MNSVSVPKSVFLVTLIIVLSFVIEYAMVRYVDRGTALVVSGLAEVVFACLLARYTGVHLLKWPSSDVQAQSLAPILAINYVAHMGAGVLGLGVVLNSSDVAKYEQNISIGACVPGGIDPFIFMRTAVLSPIAEEALFAGFLYVCLRRRYQENMFVSVFIVALLFSLFHLPKSLHAGISHMAAMVVSCLLVETFRTLLPGIFLHALHNAALLALDQFSETLCKSLIPAGPVIYALYLMCIGLVAVSIYYLGRRSAKHGGWLLSHRI